MAAEENRINTVKRRRLHLSAHHAEVHIAATSRGIPVSIQASLLGGPNHQLSPTPKEACITSA